MKLPDASEAVDLGAELARLGGRIATGQLPDPLDAVRVLSAAILAFADDIEELRPHLMEASRARQDYFVELAARAQLGPRPK